ncbi:MAG TPA: hypothetical protein PKV16_07045 [Caldisericia bacterium]|nr:hypothetical protein [Caldisericia bacterium]HPF49524.1 hypothetical protein [Caldisericia bacterium]HPI84182.1 hypothetical protein [Caldisericia bacterium]HPQ93523.1 hypothetical protein [Caldisericia bacterium]HRV75471.1 hypothetical protein [Caldisericia bacterium]
MEKEKLMYDNEQELDEVKNNINENLRMQYDNLVKRIMLKRASMNRAIIVNLAVTAVFMWLIFVVFPQHRFAHDAISGMYVPAATSTLFSVILSIIFFILLICYNALSIYHFYLSKRFLAHLFSNKHAIAEKLGLAAHGADQKHAGIWKIGMSADICKVSYLWLILAANVAVFILYLLFSFGAKLFI